MSPFMLYMGGITSFVNSAFAAFNTPIFVCLLAASSGRRFRLSLLRSSSSSRCTVLHSPVRSARNVIPALNNIHYLYFTRDPVRIRHAADVGNR